MTNVFGEWHEEISTHLRPVPGGAGAVACRGRAAGRCHPGQCPAAAHRHSRFPGRRSAEAQTGANIADVVRADLERSGLFKPIDPKAFVDHITNINMAPNFANWRVINAQGLVAGAGHAAARRPAARRFPPLGRLWRKPDAGPAILHPAGELAPHRPYGVGRDLSAHHRREGLFRHPHRLHFGIRSGHQARQAPGGDGRGRRQSRSSSPAATIWC